MHHLCGKCSHTCGMRHSYRFAIVNIIMYPHFHIRHRITVWFIILMSCHSHKRSVDVTQYDGIPLITCMCFRRMTHPLSHKTAHVDLQYYHASHSSPPVSVCCAIRVLHVVLFSYLYTVNVHVSFPGLSSDIVLFQDAFMGPSQLQVSLLSVRVPWDSHVACPDTLFVRVLRILSVAVNIYFGDDVWEQISERLILLLDVDTSCVWHDHETELMDCDYSELYIQLLMLTAI